MEFDGLRFVVEKLLDEWRILYIVPLEQRVIELETAHAVEHPATIVNMEPEGIPVEAMEQLSVETPAIVVIDDGEASEQVEALTEQVEALTDAVEVLASEQVEDAIEDTVQNAVDDAVSDVIEETIEPVDTVEVETDDSVLELPVVDEQEIKPERRGFLDRPLFGGRR